MTRVFLYRHPEQEQEVHDVGDVRRFLRQEFGPKWPAGGRISSMATGRAVVPTSNAEIADACTMPGPLVVEVFPRGPETWAALAVSLAVSTASMILTSILTPEPPNATQRNIQQESPNNGLSERVNRARVNGRIPDIYGTVRSTPDLIAPTYKIYVDHRELEIAYMCIGRGAYEIHDVRDDTTPVAEIAGASVAIYGPYTSPNSGAPQLQIGNPINWPVVTAKRITSVNGQTLLPRDVGRVVRRGTRFEWPNLIVSEDPDVDFTEYFVAGDVIQVSEAAQPDGVFTYSIPPEGAVFAADVGMSPEWGEITFSGDHSGDWSTGQIVTVTNGTIRWKETSGGDADTEYAVTGNVNGIYSLISSTYDPLADATTLRLDVTVNSSAWAAFANAALSLGDVAGGPTLARPSGVILFDLSGTYTINTLVSDRITLQTPSAANPDWTVMQEQYGGQSETLFPVVATTGDRWVGWFTIRSERPIERLIVNVVADALYADNGQQQYRRNVSYRVEAQRVDENGNPFGAVHAFERTVIGSATSRSTRASTLDVDLVNTPSNAWQVRALRLTPSDTAFEGVMVDEIKWQDLYACSVVTVPHFGDVTTAQVATFATDGALAIKERKTNMLVTRKLPRRVSGSTFTTELYATNDVADIISAICLDPKIGNRKPAEVDFDNIYNTAQDIRDYFGVDVAQFNYTIDKTGLSFEETLAMVAEAVFCKAYRRGSVIRLFFERDTDEPPALMFTHRSKVPGSEQRTDIFSQPERYDGIAYKWVDPATDAITTIYLPADRSAVNAKEIESVGVRLSAQANIQAWRAWNKMRYQDEIVQFDALPEANVLVLSERIMCSDNTRGKSWDGDIVAADGRQITLSQEFDWGVDGGPFTIFLQNSDGRIESMGVSGSGNSRQALLQREPRTPILVRGDGSYNTTAYIIANAANERKAKMFILEEKGQPNDDGTVPLKAYNFDRRYYERDHDFA